MREPAPKVDLRPDHWAIVRSALRRHVPDREVLVFGSRATWTAKDYSDLDLAIMGEEPLSLHAASALSEALGESDLPFKVDVVDWARIEDGFRRIIRRHGVAVQAPTGACNAADSVRRSLPASRSSDTESEWREQRVSQVVDLHTDTVNPRERPDDWFHHFSIPAFDRDAQPALELGTDIKSNKFTVPADAILISRLNPRIPRIWAPRLSPDTSAVASTEFLILRPTGIDRRFLEYLCRNPDFRTAFGAMVTGTSGSHQRVRASDALDLIVRVPPTNTQRAIGRILAAFDDKIELNRRMNETLEAMARALFKSWFVDFDPVRAKMEGRDTGLPCHLADLFPDRLIDSEVGEIPEGWCASTLADVARLNPESWSHHNAPDRILYVDLANTKWGYINDIQIYTWEDAPSRGRRVLRRGDTIVGTVRPGNGSFALIDRDGLTGSTGFAVLRPTSVTEREIVWCAATSHDAIERLTHLADGGAYPAIRPIAVLDTVVVLPDSRVRLVFSSLAAPLLNRLQDNQREARTLAALRDTLLPKLISGKIRVRDAARALESVT